MANPKNWQKSKMAPSSKSEKDDNKQKHQRKHKDHIIKLLTRGRLNGQLSQRLFRKLPPRVCVPLKTIVSEEFLRAGHIFLGFTKCGRYVLSYTSDCGEDDDFSFYTYHLYWWEFNLHSRLKQVHHVRLFAGEDIYTDLYLTVCEWHNDHSKLVVFGFNTRSSSSALMNMMMSDENNRDIYITITSMPPAQPCKQCCPTSTVSTIRTGGECLQHGYVLNARYQVVYPFPTFQPALQLKKDQVILLNTSYSLVACAISLCPGTHTSPSAQVHTHHPLPRYTHISLCPGTHTSPSAQVHTHLPLPRYTHITLCPGTHTSPSAQVHTHHPLPRYTHITHISLCPGTHTSPSAQVHTHLPLPRYTHITLCPGTHTHHPLPRYTHITLCPGTHTSPSAQVHTHHPLPRYTHITLCPGTHTSPSAQVHTHHTHLPLPRYTHITLCPGTHTSPSAQVHTHLPLPRYTHITHISLCPGTHTSPSAQVHTHHPLPRYTHITLCPGTHTSPSAQVHTHLPLPRYTHITLCPGTHTSPSAQVHTHHPLPRYTHITLCPDTHTSHTSPSAQVHTHLPLPRYTHIVYARDGQQDCQNNQILYRKRETSSSSPPPPAGPSSPSSSSSTSSEGSPDLSQLKPHFTPLSPGQSQAAVRAREFAADIFRRAQAGTREHDRCKAKEKEETDPQRSHSEEDRTRERRERDAEVPGPSSSSSPPAEAEESAVCNTVMSPGSLSSVSSLSPHTHEPSSSSSSSEPAYVNYTTLRYRLPQARAAEQPSGEEEDKVQLPFTVTDLKGRNLQLVTGQYSGQCVCIEQLTLDFEYLINEVIRNDAVWGSQFCSFSDYDVVILEVCPETNKVVINIGLLLLAFSNCEDEHCRPKSYHSSLQVSWDLNTGACRTVGVGDLTEVKGQTSGSVWSSYRKSCVNTVMRWLVPESSSRYINRMTNEAMHKGSSLQVLADNDRSTWIVL
ncbi:unnamed protein product [Leuciscus chuanchicus]